MNSIGIITRQFMLNTRWFENVLTDVNEDQSKIRINDQTNHLRWIAGHLLSIRYRNAGRLGLKTDPWPHYETFVIPGTPPPNGRPLDDKTDYPALKETLRFWKVYSPYLTTILPQLTDDQLAVKLPFELPIGGNTVLDGFAFSVMHETYHLGQMNLIRKSLGYPVMKYF